MEWIAQQTLQRTLYIVECDQSIALPLISEHCSSYS
jgi:hypothetical protein